MVYFPLVCHSAAASEIREAEHFQGMLSSTSAKDAPSSPIRLRFWNWLTIIAQRLYLFITPRLAGSCCNGLCSWVVKVCGIVPTTHAELEPDHRRLAFMVLADGPRKRPSGPRVSPRIYRVSRLKCSIFSGERNYVKQFQVLQGVKIINHPLPSRSRKGLMENEM
jgi:hypothetical protein